MSATIVITGAALASCLGITRDQTWKAVSQGRCGMGPMSAMETRLDAGKDGGQAMDLPPEFAPDLPRQARYVKWTIEDAVRDAGYWGHLPERTGVILGTTLHGMRAAGEFLRNGNPEPMKHFLAGSTLELAIRDLNVRGWCATTCSACSSSLGAIALAVSLLQSGQLDVAIAGGYDTISEYVYGGFNSLRLVADGPLRPFSKLRQGMKLAEGYGIVVLERRESAELRSARVQAVVGGFGESADAHHLTQPHPEGRGAAQAISSALRSAGLSPGDIDLISAHATGTPDNDAAEFAALKSIFTDQLPTVPVVAFKSHLGHTLGGAGAVELILSACALRDQMIPACPNSPDDQIEFAGLNLSTKTVRKDLRASLNLSLGFGGANTCIVLVRENPAATDERSRDHLKKKSSASAPAEREPVITGVGVIIPGAVGNEAFAKLLSASPQNLRKDVGAVPEDEYIHLLNARRVRRMSDYVKLTLAATALASKNAGIAGNSDWLENCCALLGTMHGSANYSAEYYRGIIAQGWLGANPMLFAEGVPNAAAAHLSLMLGLHGSCQTIIGTRTAGLDALGLAALRIRTGQWDRAIVSAGEEYSPIVNSAYRHCGLYASENGESDLRQHTGFVVGAGSVTFIIESRSLAESRRARIYGYIENVSARNGAPSDVPERLAELLSCIDQPGRIISSANATWIDRAEKLGIDRQGLSFSSLYGRIAETFSAGPLLAIAAGLLGGQLLSPPPSSCEKFTSICTDFTGAIAGVSVKPESGLVG